MASEASDILRREPEMRAKTEKAKARVQGITDIEKLRSLALKYCDHLSEPPLPIDFYQHMRGAMLGASLGTATMAAVLAYSLYGLREKNRMA